MQTSHFFLLLGLLFLSNSVSAQDNDDANVNSIYFSYITTCSAEQRKSIVQGWNDAITIAKMVKANIDWSGAAELEFLGPSQFNSEYHSNVQAIFNNAATFDRGSLFDPAFWFAYVGCKDWKNRCTPGTKAYMHNVDYQTGMIPQQNDPASTMRLTLCPEFFFYKSLKSRVDKGKAKQNDDSTKWDLDYYKNLGYIILHEMMHANVVAYTPNKSRHITDLQMLMTPIGGQGSNYYAVYGSEYTKVMARTQKGSLGGWVTRNDSLAVYGLAKYVSGEIGGYPYLPLVTKIGIGEAIPKFGSLFIEDTDGQIYLNETIATARNGSLVIENYLSSDLTVSMDCSSSDDGDCDTLEVINVTNWTDDSEYPPDYIQQLNAWKAASDANTEPSLDTTPDTIPDLGDMSLDCTSDMRFPDGTGMFDVATAQGAIASTCNAWQGSGDIINSQDFQDTASYNIPNSTKKLWLGAFWNKGVDSCATGQLSIDSSECVAMLTSIVNTCDQGQDQKRGGYKVDGCVIWGLEVTDGPP